MHSDRQELLTYLNQVMLQLYHELPGTKDQKNKVIRESIETINQTFDLVPESGDLEELRKFWSSYQDDPDLGEYAGTYLFAIEDVRRGFEHMHDLKNP